MNKKSFFEKLFCLLIFIGIEILIGFILSKITFGNFGKVFMLFYCFMASSLALIFAIGLDEGDF